jgi:hypothetical protein
LTNILILYTKWLVWLIKRAFLHQSQKIMEGGKRPSSQGGDNIRPNRNYSERNELDADDTQKQ